MKKLLSLLATVSLVSTSTASIVACGNGNNGSIDNDDNDDNDDYEEKEFEQDISTIINKLDLGEIIFNSLDGSDFDTQNAISERIRNLNPNVGDAQINISNIDQINNFATISIQGYTGTVTVSFIVITSINVLITDTDLGDINFYSLTGNDEQTRIEIIDQVRTLNPNVGDAQINISNINQLNSTATISVVGFNGALTVTFTPLHASEIEPILPVSFPSAPNSIIQLQDGTILIAGGTAANGSDSFLASVNLSNTINPVQILAQGLFPSILRSIIELYDGTIIVAGGSTNNGSDAFLASLDLSDPANPQTRTLAQGLEIFPSAPNSIIQLQDGTILVVGGTTAIPFLASVDLSNPADPQIQILAQGSTAFPAAPNSIIQLQDGTILVVGGVATNGSNSFLASVDLSNTINPVQILAQGSTAFPSAPISSIELYDGTILVGGGTAANGSNSFLASVDLSNPANPQTQTVAQGSTAFPSVLQAIIKLYDGRILVAGGTSATNAFLRMI